MFPGRDRRSQSRCQPIWRIETHQALSCSPITGSGLSRIASSRVLALFSSIGSAKKAFGASQPGPRPVAGPRSRNRPSGHALDRRLFHLAARRVRSCPVAAGCSWIRRAAASAAGAACGPAETARSRATGSMNRSASSATRRGDRNAHAATRTPTRQSTSGSNSRPAGGYDPRARVKEYPLRGHMCLE
ncbi:hypothetical protein EV128_107195 [Rhizobium azibense]|nr:hypothetical protein EV128_107195 [Rhizobium azibense]